MSGPLGPERADLHAAIVASTVANVMGGRKGKRYKPADFMPDWGKAQPAGPQSEHDHLSLVRSLNRRLGGQTRQKGGHG